MVHDDDIFALFFYFCLCVLLQQVTLPACCILCGFVWCLIQFVMILGPPAQSTARAGLGACIRLACFTCLLPCSLRFLTCLFTTSVLQLRPLSGVALVTVDLVSDVYVCCWPDQSARTLAGVGPGAGAGAGVGPGAGAASVRCRCRYRCKVHGAGCVVHGEW